MSRRLFTAVLLCFASACTRMPVDRQSVAEVIPTGPGPEDMIFDTMHQHILISCSARRQGAPYYGEIEALNLSTLERHAIPRISEPENLKFNPHGIDLVLAKDTLTLLVANHENEINRHSVLRYMVSDKKLIFLQQITHPLITSPNAITGFEDGGILISNDAKKHGSIAEMIFKLRKAQIIYWNGSGCSVASGKYCYSNGITQRNGKVYLVSTMQHKVWQFEWQNGKLENRKAIAHIKGGDNIRFDDSALLVPAHLRFTAFIKHMQKSGNLSPTTVYRIYPETGKTEVVFFDSGAQISAGSTALKLGGQLYICGVFDPKIVRTGSKK